MITDLADFHARLSVIDKENPDSEIAELAVLLVDEMTPKAQRDILIHLTTKEVLLDGRSQARLIEEQARRRAAESPPRQVSTPEENPDAFERLYADPTAPVCLNRTERRDFAQWVNRRDGKGGYDAWLSGALDVVGDDEFFKMDWIPGYAHAARNRDVGVMIGQFLIDYAEMIRFEVTAELLDSVFAIGDGTKVSWRDATVAQHEERISMLTKMIDGTAETAAMHIKAVQMIKDAGVESLAQLTDPPA